MFDNIKNFRPHLSNKTPEVRWWHHLNFKRDSKAREAVDQLMDNSRLEEGFFVMCMLSGTLATLGILLNDVAILIAAMVLAPILNPVLALAAGISVMNKTLIWYATKSFVGSVVFVIIVSAFLVKILAMQGYNFDIDPFLRKFSSLNHLLFLAAFISGFSGVYAWLKATNMGNMIGVAIAVSLIPFISFFGVLVGLEQFEELHWYAFTFTINLLAIILGATTAFLMLGFSRAKKAIATEVVINAAEKPKKVEE